MNGDDSTEESARLRRLIERGARMRPWSERERRALLVSLEQKLTRARAPMLGSRVPIFIGLCLIAAMVVGRERHRWSTPSAPTAERTPAKASVVPRQHRTEAPETAARVSAPRRIVVQGRGEITLESSAIASVPADLTARAGPLSFALERGRLAAQLVSAPDVPLSIVTPHAVIQVVSARFSILATESFAEVRVETGSLRMERGVRSLTVDAGASVRSNDPRLEARPPARAGWPAKLSCGKHARDGACLPRVALDAELAAENALLSLALSERDRGDASAALALLRDYERRFPRGRLTREVAIAMVRTLRREGLQLEACAHADDFARRFPDDRLTVSRLRTLCAE